MPDLHAAALIAVMALVTMALRFLPFLIFNEDRETPPIITYLGKVLPYAIMGMLVVYCLKDAGTDWFGIGLPKLAAVVIVALAYRLSRNTLLSIFVGTAGYMLLIRLL